MWLRAPERIGGISVEGINYVVEFSRIEPTQDGPVTWNYFRAADHLVPTIIATGMGFETCERPEGCDLDDLPRVDPLRDGAIADALREISQLRKTVDEQKTEISQLNAAIGMISLEKENLTVRVEELLGQLGDMQSVCEVLRDMVPAKKLEEFDAKTKEPVVQ